MRRLVSVLFVVFCGSSLFGQTLTLPAGFSRVQVGVINNPTVMAFAPDGRLFVAEQSGILRVIKNDQLLPTPFITLTVNSLGERGLIGIAFDPGFATNNFIYLYYTVNTAPIHNRISRFTANGDVVVPGSEQIILELDALSAATNHNGGALAFGKDGYLYVAIGENANGAYAQNLDIYHGKFLRLNKDGSAPSDNPLFATGTARSKRFWAWGLRNPYTFSIHPITGRIFINDVGQGTWEEVDDATTGGRNFGWPTTEGPINPPNPNFTGPVFAYSRATPFTGSCAITGGTFFFPSNTNYPPLYYGKYFFLDFCANWIYYFDPGQTNPTPSLFASNIGASSLSLTAGPDGNLYYMSRALQRVYKIIYTPPPGSPAITTHPQPVTVNAGQSATFSVTATGTAPLSYQWLKSGSTLAGKTEATLTIPATAVVDGGNYYVTASNSIGSVTSNQALLTVNPVTTPPVESPAITTHPQPVTVDAGQSATFSVTATGTAPLSYQWLKSGNTLADKTEATLTIPATVVDDGGNYYVTVSNSIGSVTSNQALLTVNPVNTPPVGTPAITAHPQPVTVNAGQSATFSVTATGTAPLSYQWIKSGSTLTGKTEATLTIPTTVIGDGGNYYVTVSNSIGSVTTNQALLTVNPVSIPNNQPPTATIVKPADGATYVAGTAIAFEGTGTDPEDGSLTASSLSWAINFHHDTHKHDQPPISGAAGSFDIPNRGETASNVWYRFILTATDAGGLKAKDSVDVHPLTSKLTFATIPAGLQVTVDGQPVTTPVTITSVEGLQRDIGVAQQVIGDDTFSFATWSQGGIAAQTITTPTDDATYTANFSGVTGVEDPEQAVVYPNPAEGVIYIADAEVSSVTIINSVGKSTLLIPIGGALDVTHLAPGMYVLVYANKKVKLIIK